MITNSFGCIIKTEVAIGRVSILGVLPLDEPANRCWIRTNVTRSKCDNETQVGYLKKTCYSLPLGQFRIKSLRTFGSEPSRPTKFIWFASASLATLYAVAVNAQAANATEWPSFC